MPVFALGTSADFPPATRAGRRGLLAVGGDLSPRRLLRAYGGGIFPWYEESQPVLWWSPDPRFVLFPGEFHRGATLRKVLRRGGFSFAFDRDFAAVIDACARPRAGEPGTWITPDMRRAYVRLHEHGYAHSLEARQGGELVGGLYGVSLGGCFFAESMFHSVANASKAALAVLDATLADMDFLVIDCQVPTPHLAAWGGRSIPRRRYLQIVRQGLRRRTLRGSWAGIAPSGISE
ncbi:MAG TPA: leucyl/phenylalanyl-tRNA--protein transferase [Candidatus Aminicenantes bacterium]|nr:leucyl/phenylalanyl-tRNA--protein transferase [Candidatus Aminicenantes bacterium]